MRSSPLSLTVFSLGAAVLLGACDSPTNQMAPLEATVAESRSSTALDQATGLLRADLAELNGSGAAGQATLRLKGHMLEVTLTAQGLSAELPHAQHIHIGGMNVCPRPEEDFSGDDDLVNTVEGVPAYGGVRVALTTEGDASGGSALAVARFPVANSAGIVTYRRDINLNEIGVDPSEIMGGSIVVHGDASLFGDQSAYDGEMKSSITDALPLEATIPALCGEVSAPADRHAR